MPDGARLTQTRIHAGLWEGMLTGAGPDPRVEVRLDGRALPGLVLQPVPGRPGDYALRLPIPPEVLSEGVQTFLFCSGDRLLAQFTILTGAALDDDLRSEIGLLRAELDLLKRAFRRHCSETAG